ncbi:MAG: tRNA pseudouridine(38-40) synthase TruA, partial [Hyphomicrobiales bacterium]
MPRYRLIIEYDGAGYVGWQQQDNGPSVQAALQQAVKGFSGEEVRVFGAGRTDAGVHALGQAAHIDLARAWDADRVREAMNAHLRGHAIAVLAVEEAAENFDARFSAVGRHYLYRIVNRRPPLALARGQAWHVMQPLDAAAMHEAAQALIGRHDFSTFRDAQCQAKSPVKTLDAISVAREGEGVEIRVSARSFLHRQVRSIAGSLKKVGEGAWPPERMAEILKAADRRLCGPV